MWSNRSRVGDYITNKLGIKKIFLCILNSINNYPSEGVRSAHMLLVGFNSFRKE